VEETLDKPSDSKCRFALINTTEVSSVLFDDQEQGFTPINSPTEEADEGGKAAIEDQDLLDSGRGLYLQYGGYLVGLASIPH